MGIAEDKPRQLAPTVGTTGSGSTDSPAPSPTTSKIDIDTIVGIAAPTDIDTTAKVDIDTIVGIAVLTDIDTTAKINIDTIVGIVAPTDVDTTAKIDIDTIVGIATPINVDSTAKISLDTIIGIAAPTDVDISSELDIDTIAGIAGPAIVNDGPMEPEIDAVDSTIIDSASLGTINLTPTADVIDPTSGTTGVAPGGYNMAFRLFNFHVDSSGTIELLSIAESAPLMAETMKPPAIGGKSSTSVSLASSEEGLKPKTLTPSVGSNDFEDPPPSPTTAYCVDCDAYHYVGAGDFSSHEIAGCEDPRGGTAAVYPTISECDRALNALTLHTAPYDPDYVEGLYSDYTCSDDDDVYPKAKGKIGNSASSASLCESNASSDGYVADYDSNFIIEVGPYVESDDVYPPVLGEISDDSTPWPGGHCMMASHGDGNENDGRNRADSGCQVVTHDQIRFAKRVYAGEVNFGPNRSPSDLAALRFVIQEQKDHISADRRVLERRREEADASSRRRAERSSHYSSSIQHRSRIRTQPGADMHNITRNLEAEFNEAELMPKTKEAVIMAVAAYITANASNGDEHM
jgi:hypothetical protein